VTGGFATGMHLNLAAENRLRFVFTNIDPSKHERPFTFSVFINEQNVYQSEFERRAICVRAHGVAPAVAECSPAVSDIDVLLEKLNCTNNFGAFVQHIRRRFRDIALE
jgi:hypothetical protein